MQRDVVRVAEVTVAVPDPAASATFFAGALGLHRRRDDLDERLTVTGDYGLGAPPGCLRLVRGDLCHLAQVDLELLRDARSDELIGRLDAAGVAYHRDGASVRFADPDGLTIVCRPPAPPLPEALPPSTIRPRRLGHVNLKVPDAARSARFWQDAVGLALSEQVGDLLYFLRAGSEHHNVGIRGRAEHVDVHHIAFEVPGWESYRVICDRLADMGHTVEYGPGRHGPGNNLFVYVRDPASGLRVELYADMARIDDDATYVPPKWTTADRARTMNRWGPGPPDSFLE